VPGFNVLERNNMHDSTAGGITLWQDGWSETGYGGYIRIEGNVINHHAYGAANFDGMQIGGGDADSAGHHVAVIENEITASGNANAGPDPMDLGGHTYCSHYLEQSNYWHANSGDNFKCHAGYRHNASLPTEDCYTDGRSGHHIVRFNVYDVRVQQYEFPNPITYYNNTWIDTGQMTWWWVDSTITPAPNGDTTYATWIAAQSLSDTDTGRLTYNNNLFFQNAASSALIHSQDNSPVMDWTYQSLRMQGNVYKPASGQTIRWNGTSYTTAQFATYQASNTPNFPDTDSTMLSTGTTLASMFNNAGAADYQLASGSAGAVGISVAHSFALGDGTNSTTLTCDRASMFCDGYYKNGERVTRPDMIKIGSGSPVLIQSIAEGTDPSVFNVITLQEARSWGDGDEIWLCDPDTGNPIQDAGAFAWSGAVRPVKPINVRVTALAGV